MCSDGPDRAVSNPADQRAVFQLAGRACSWPAGVTLQSQSAANPLRTDQCGVREKGRGGGRSGGGRGRRDVR